MLLGSFFQERVCNFAINVFLLQNASITEQNMGIKILEAGGLAQPEELIMNEAMLNSVHQGSGKKFIFFKLNFSVSLWDNQVQGQESHASIAQEVSECMKCKSRV